MHHGWIGLMPSFSALLYGCLQGQVRRAGDDVAAGHGVERARGGDCRRDGPLGHQRPV